MATNHSLRTVFRAMSGTVLAAMLLFPAVAEAGGTPTFSKAFSPSTIGPGANTRLTFTIANGLPSVVSNLAFSDTLPAGVTISTPSVTTTSCGGTLTAPAGGGTIALSGGVLAANATCAIEVNVTSSTAGVYMNVSGDLTSSVGNSGPASADLTVVTTRPGFSKSFAPSAVGLGGRSTLTLTIDNSANGSLVAGLTFVDNLPTGLEIADPANATSTCNGLLTASPGGSTISMTSGILLAGQTCTVVVDIRSAAIGTFDNVSGDLSSSPGGPAVSSGFATSSLSVTGGSLPFTKAFTDDPVPPGGTVTLEFSITNANRASSATGITFTDDLDATLSGLVATGLPALNICGAGSSLTGTSTLTLIGGTLPAGGTCTFSVPLQVPAAAATGAYPNTTSSISATVGGSPVVSPPATETLFVNEAPLLTKTFLDNPAGTGQVVTVEFSVTNNSSTSGATNISFQDNLTAFLSGVTVSALPANGFCGGGSSLTAGLISGDLYLFMSGGSLPASGSCTFTVDLQIPAGNLSGTFTNTTDPIQATVDGMTQVGQPASDDLTILAPPSLSKSFTDDPVAPGDTVTLEFTISHDETAPADATGITFTDDLNAALTGLAAVGLPMNDVCGTGSVLSGTTTLTLTGGTLVPGASCTFSATLQVPPGASPGTYSNITSSIMAMVSGVSVTGNPGADDLQISGLELTKSFTDDPVIAGDTVTLEFTIANTSAADDATDIFFTDDLNAVISGLAAEAPLPMTPCGPGSSITGTTSLTFMGGTLTAGTSCTFSVTVRVPPAAADNTYFNATSNLVATINAATVVLPPATDSLTVSSSVLALSKAFTDDPVAPGDTVTLEFTVTNLDPDQTATGITFTDDLDAALTGLVATGLPAMDVCGVGSSLTGTSVLTLSGGTLAGGASCTFSVTLTVPGGTSGTVATNTTSTITGMIAGLPVDGPAASDDLLIQNLVFSKSFNGPTVAGGSPVLTFTIQNVSSSAISGLSFTDDLDAALSGLVATGLPMTAVCGAGSQISGTSFLTFTGGNLLPNGSCSFMVSLAVPAGAAPGMYVNTTSDLFQAGLSVAEPAVATLTVAPPPTFSKVFAPDMVVQGAVSTLTFTIDNTASSVAASSLTLVDNLPAGVVVAVSPNASTTCTGGTLSAVPGMGTVMYSGGTVAAGASCTVSADAVGTVPGAQVNTTQDLTSSSGNSGTATDTLTVTPAPAPGFSKVFAPDAIGEGQTSTLTFTIDNTGALVAATGLDFTDNLPAGMQVAAAPNASTTCTGGTLTATAGTGVISYTGGTVAAASSCTVTVDVAGNAPGSLVNTSGDLTSSLGNSGTATDTLVVNPVPGFTKAFAPNPIAVGGVSTLTFTIDNTGSTVAVTGLDFTDTLPAGLEVASPPNAATTCTGGTVTAAAGGGVISYTGGTAAAGSLCTVTTDVMATASGSLANTSGDLTSSLGNSGPATDTLVVNPAPGFTKAFAPDVIVSGGVSTLTFTIDNSASTAAATGLDFTDSLPAGMTVAPTANASTTCTGGTLTATAGTGMISYTGGSLAAGATCTLQADVTSSTSGVSVNTSFDLTSSLGNSGPATASLTVDQVMLTLTKTTITNPVLPGGFVDFQYTISNSSSSLALTGITFTDDLDAVIPGLVAVSFSPLAGGDPCGSGSTFSGTSVLTLSGGNLPANGSCTFSATLQIPANAVEGTYTSTTSPLSASGSGGSVAGAPASADLVITALTIEKFFSNVSVNAGELVDLIFTLTNPDPVNTASGITFTDDLEAALTGLVAVGLPMADVCGTGSVVDGTSIIQLTGGTLAGGTSCTFTVTVQVPADAVSGSLTNITSGVDSTVGGLAVTGNPAMAATADLLIVAVAVAIPTLSTWGMLLLLLLLSAVAIRRLRFQ